MAGGHLSVLIVATLPSGFARCSCVKTLGVAGG
jgi:hypothetical protein